MNRTTCLVVSLFALIGLDPAWAQEKKFDWVKADDPAVAAWVAQSAEWQSLAPYDVGRLSARLKTLGESGRPARAAVISFLLKLDPSKLNAYTADNLLSLSQTYAEEFSADERTRWRGKIESVIHGRLAGLKWRDVAVSADALKAAGHDNPNGLVAGWAEKSANLALLGTTELQGVVGRLASAGEKGKAGRAAIVAQIERKFLADKQSATAAGHVGLGNLISAVAGDLAQEKRDLWAQRIEGFFVDVTTNRHFVSGMLSTLGHGGAAKDLNRKWVEGHTNWQELPPEGVMWLLRGLIDGKEQTKVARLKVAQFIEASYLKDAATARSVGIDTWVSYVQFTGQDLSPESRSKWAAVLQSAYADGADAATSGKLAGMLKSLDATAAADQAKIKWVVESDQWKSYKPDALASLAGEMAKSGEAGKAARDAIAAHVKAVYLADKSKAAQLTISEWSGLNSSLAASLSAADRGLWMERLKDAFIEDRQTLATVTAGDFTKLTALMQSLGDDQAEKVEPLWVAASPNWRQLTPYACGQLARRLAKAGPAAEAARQRVIGGLTEMARDSAKARQFGYDAWKSCGEAFRSDMSAELKATWAKCLSAALIETPTVLDELRPAIATAIETLRLLNDKSTAELIAAITSKYLADASAARSVSFATWDSLVQALAKDLPGETKSVWAGRLQDAFGRSDGAIAGKLAGMLRTLDATAAADQAKIKWVVESDQWKSYKPDALASLAGEMAKSGEAGKAARDAIAAHVKAVYLAEKSKAAALSVSQWSSLVSSLGGSFNAEDRGLCRARLREVYVLDSAALASLKWADLGTLTGVLRQLEDPAAEAVLVAWLDRSNEWLSFDPPQLGAVAGKLAALKDAGRAGRMKLIEHLSRRMGDNDFFSKATLSTWHSYANCLAADASAETKAAWANRLIAAHRSKDGATRSTLKAVLGVLGQAEAARELECRWVRETDEWKSLPPAELVSLAGSLATAGDAGTSARAKMIEFLGAKFLADDAAVRSLPIDSWQRVAEIVKKDLAPKARLQWAAKIKAAFGDVSDAKSLHQLAAIMGHLDDADAAKAFKGKWAAGSAEWRTWTHGRLVSLAAELAADMAGSAEARAILAVHVKANIIAQHDAVKALGFDDVCKLVLSLADQVRQDDRPAWVASVRKAFVEDTSSLAAASHSNCMTLTRALKALGDPGADQLEALWVIGSTQWQPLGWYQWVQLCSRLDAAGDKGKAARLAVIQALSGGYLADPAKAREIPPEGWKGLIACLLKEVPAEQRPEWADRLRAAFTGSQAGLDTMKHRDVGILVESLKLLGHAKAEETWALWVEHSTVWTGTDSGGISSLSASLSKLEDAGANARAKLIDHLNKQYLADVGKVRSMGMAFWSNLVARLIGEMKTETRVLWATRLQEAFANYRKPGDNMTQAQLLWALRQLQSP